MTTLTYTDLCNLVDTTATAATVGAAISRIRVRFRREGLPLAPLGGGNNKTAIPGTYRPGSTCSDSCPFKGNGGCYAQHAHLRPIYKGADPSPDAAVNAFIAAAVVSLKRAGGACRVHVGGDVGSRGLDVDGAYVVRLAAASRAVRRWLGDLGAVTGYTYTHVRSRELAECLTDAGIVTLLSDYTGIGGALVVTKDTSDEARVACASNGAKLVACPAQVSGDVHCRTCRLCERAYSLKIAVSFTPHGSGRSRLASDPRSAWWC